MTGGFAVLSSSSNIGLAAATGAVSRFVGYGFGEDQLPERLVEIEIRFEH